MMNYNNSSEGESDNWGTPEERLKEAGAKAASAVNQCQQAACDVGSSASVQPASALERVEVRLDALYAAVSARDDARYYINKELKKLRRVQHLLTQPALGQQEVMELLAKLEGTGIV